MEATTNARKLAVSGEEFFDNLVGSIMRREQPRRFIVGEGAFDRVNVCRGRIITVGGLVGAGKTALSMQWVLHAIQADPSLRVLVANVETDRESLMERQIARVAGVPADIIHERRFEDTDDDVKHRIWTASLRIRETMPRMYFAEPSATTDDIRDLAIEFGAELLVVDFIQKLKRDGKRPFDETAHVQAVMEDLLEMKRNGLTIIALSSMRRDNPGSPAPKFSFRGSSDVEYLSDECYALETADRPAADGLRDSLLRQLKGRFRELTDIPLWFDASLQAFTPKGGAA